MIALEDISKAFAGNEVLHAVSVRIAPRQVTAASKTCAPETASPRACTTAPSTWK